MRQNCLVNMAIAQGWEMAHTGCRSCWRLAGSTAAHGNHCSGRAAAAIEGSVRVAASLLEAVQRMAMRLQAMVAARDVGRPAGIAAAVVSVAEAAAAEEAAAGIAQAKEPAWAQAATLRKTCWRVGGRRGRRGRRGRATSTRKGASFTRGGDYLVACRIPSAMVQKAI